MVILGMISIDEVYARHSSYSSHRSHSSHSSHSSSSHSSHDSHASHSSHASSTVHSSHGNVHSNVSYPVSEATSKVTSPPPPVIEEKITSSVFANEPNVILPDIDIPTNTSTSQVTTSEIYIDNIVTTTPTTSASEVITLLENTGDVNLDGIFSIQDALDIAGYILKKDNVSVTDLMQMDVNIDGNVNIMDLIRLKRFIVDKYSID